jgi:ADP-ribose pyrophosphatase YjhB (NUDIX family)
MNSAHENALELLDSWVGHPGKGLPYELFLFISTLVPMVNVDLLITDDRKRVLLTWRDDEIHGKGWHVPGGMIRYKETAEERILATARDELGAGVAFHPAAEIEQIIEPRRRLRGHHIALLYRCRLTSEPSETLRFTGGEPKRGQWAWHQNCPVNLIDAHRCYCRFFEE